MWTRRRRAIACASTIVAGAAALTLLLSGCAPEGGGATNSESAKQQRDFAALYEQGIEWGECDEAFDLEGEQIDGLKDQETLPGEFGCAMVEAPFDWNDPENDEKIELAVVHIPTAGEDRLGVLFGNPGGPGMSGLQHTYDMSVAPRFDEVLQSYDLVGFDPRGIGRSSPIDCDAAARASENRALQLALCAETNPLALRMGTQQVARDMELLRHLVGDDELHYLGYSYGTMLGATYSTLFPERVGRMVLDSAAPSDWASPNNGFMQNLAIDEAIGAMIEECGSEYPTRFCPLDGKAQLPQLLGGLDEQPLIASDGTEVGSGMLRGYLTTGLYQLRTGREQVLDVVGRAPRRSRRPRPTWGVPSAGHPLCPFLSAGCE